MRYVFSMAKSGLARWVLAGATVPVLAATVYFAYLTATASTAVELGANIEASQCVFGVTAEIEASPVFGESLASTPLHSVTTNDSGSLCMTFLSSALNVDHIDGSAASVRDFAVLFEAYTRAVGGPLADVRESFRHKLGDAYPSSDDASQLRSK